MHNALLNLLQWPLLTLLCFLFSLSSLITSVYFSLRRTLSRVLNFVCKLIFDQKDEICRAKCLGLKMCWVKKKSGHAPETDSVCYGEVGTPLGVRDIHAKQHPQKLDNWLIRCVRGWVVPRNSIYAFPLCLLRLSKH